MRRSSLWALLVLAACGGDRSSPDTTSDSPARSTRSPEPPDAGPAPIQAAARPAAAPPPAGEADSGHPYARELISNLYSAWQVPAADLGGEVLACVKLARDGSIADRLLKKRAGNELDRSVERALRDAPAMGKPVPPELVTLLTEKGICVRFAVVD